MRLLSVLLVTAGLAVTETHAADVVVASGRLIVGKTNILCVQAPCPWRGIAAADERRAGPGGLLWSEQTLPPMDASEENTNRIVQAWDGDQCLAIEGTMTGGRLKVEKIVGECP